MLKKLSGGQITLHVVETKNLWDEKAVLRTRSPYITIKAPGEPLGEFRRAKTRPYSDTKEADLQFNEVFLANVTNKDEPIVFNIASKGVTGKEELGEAKLDLQQLEPGQPVDLWLPVNRDAVFQALKDKEEEEEKKRKEREEKKSKRNELKEKAKGKLKEGVQKVKEAAERKAGDGNAGEQGDQPKGKIEQSEVDWNKAPPNAVSFHDGHFYDQAGNIVYHVDAPVSPAAPTVISATSSSMVAPVYYATPIAIDVDDRHKHKGRRSRKHSIDYYQEGEYRNDAYDRGVYHKDDHHKDKHRKDKHRKDGKDRRKLTERFVDKLGEAIGLRVGEKVGEKVGDKLVEVGEKAANNLQERAHTFREQVHEQKADIRGTDAAQPGLTQRARENAAATTAKAEVKFEDAAAKAASVVENLGGIAGEGARLAGIRSADKIEDAREKRERKKELKRLGLYEGKADKIQKKAASVVANLGAKIENRLDDNKDDDESGSGYDSDSDDEGGQHKRRERLKDKALTLLTTLLAQASGMGDGSKGERLKSNAKEGVAKLGEKAQEKISGNGDESGESDWSKDTDESEKGEDGEGGGGDQLSEKIGQIASKLVEMLQAKVTTGNDLQQKAKDKASELMDKAGVGSGSSSTGGMSQQMMLKYAKMAVRMLADKAQGRESFGIGQGMAEKLRGRMSGANEKMQLKLAKRENERAILSTKAEIHIVAVFTPMVNKGKGIGKSFIQRLPPFRFALDRSTYFAGECVSGMVLLNVSKPYDIDSLTLNFKGRQSVVWSEANRNQPLTYSKRNLIFDSTVNLISKPKTSDSEDDSETISKTKMESGQHAFPFEFTLPVNIPPSMTFNDTKTEYTIIAKCHRSDGKSCSIKAPLNVMIEPASIRLESDAQVAQPQLLQPHMPEYSGQLSAPQIQQLGRSQDLEAHIVGGGSVFNPGSEATIKIRLMNTSGRTLESLKLSLVQTVVLKSDYKSRTWKNYFINHELRGQNNFPIPNGEERNFTVTVHIPDDPLLIPTVTRDISPLIGATYHFKIWSTAVGSNDPWSSELKSKVHVRIGYKPNSELAGLPRPLAPMGNPAEIRLIDKITLTPKLASTFPINVTGGRALDKSKLEFTIMDINGVFSSTLKDDQHFRPGKLAKVDTGGKPKDEMWDEWRFNQNVSLFPGISFSGDTWSSPSGGVPITSKATKPLPTNYDENVTIHPVDPNVPVENIVTDLPMPSIPPPPPPPLVKHWKSGSSSSHVDKVPPYTPSTQSSELNEKSGAYKLWSENEAYKPLPETSEQFGS